LRCGNEFQPTSFGHRYCGKQKTYGTCSWLEGRDKRNAWIAANKEAYDKQRKDWAANNVERLRKIHRRKVLKKYALSSTEFTEMLSSQHGNCAICDEYMAKPNIDHNHTTGKVRGLLCTQCNTRLGHMESEWKAKAEAYLALHE
jgi:hypothetical protein